MARPVRGPGKPESVTRKIHFFRLDAGVDENGELKPVDLQRALKAVNELPFKTSPSAGRYVTSGEVDLCTWVDAVGTTSSLRFAAVRRNVALPT